MHAALVDLGVPPAVLVRDHDGVHTHATACFTRDCMQAHGLRSVIAVSQFRGRSPAG